MLVWFLVCPKRLAWPKLFPQGKEVYLGKQSFSNETGLHMTRCYAQLRKTIFKIETYKEFKGFGT